MTKKFFNMIHISPIALILFPLIWIVYAAVVILKFTLLGISVDEFNQIVEPGVWERRIFLIALCFLLEYIFSVIEPVIDNWYVEGKMRALRVALGEKINRLPYRKIESMEKGEVLSKCSVDTQKVQVFLEDDIPTFGITFFLGISGFIICFMINIKFLAAFLLAVPIVMVLGMLSGYLLRGNVMEWREYTGKVNGLGLEILKKFATVKIFALESRKKKEFEERAFAESEKEKEIAQKKARYSFIKALCLALPTLVLMLTGAWLVWRGEISAGSFTIMLAMSSKVANLTGSVQWFFYEKEEFKGSANRILELHQQEEDITGKEGIPVKQEKTGYAVEIRNLSFRYGKDEREVLKNINLKIKRGQKTAIVGPSGCGKSTLLNLISGLYTDKEGEIWIDGIADIPEQITAVREKTSCIMQKDYLFHTTIEENISCGKDETEQNQVALAAQKAYIDEFIDSLPEGYHTEIAEDGKNLSQGQKQRICLARVLFHGKPILLLDEPTAALDWKSEQLVKKSIQELGEDVTVIAVSHNKAFIEEFDYVYRMDGGQIVEEGTMERRKNAKGQMDDAVCLKI